MSLCVLSLLSLLLNLLLRWNVPQLEGEDLYSKNFHSATTLLKWHASNAGKYIVVPYHNGATTHVIVESSRFSLIHVVMFKLLLMN